ncbi:MAG: class I SAM-dependent methyltransferase [Nanoarchaeota archaeon]|nr:class I SAM-dependent methyltransferase [Nanoarchaeota archaeon]MBU1946475.1 class I SAM-dependent methyltransferase [Nanoarchaeota archaeon]
MTNKKEYPILNFFKLKFVTSFLEGRIGKETIGKKEGLNDGLIRARKDLVAKRILPDKFIGRLLNEVDENKVRKALHNILVGSFYQYVGGFGMIKPFDLISARSKFKYFIHFDLLERELRGKYILDVGCGGSNFADYCNQNILDCRVFSMDLSNPDALQHSNPVYKEHTDTLSFQTHVTAAWQFIPFQDNKLDLVLSYHGALQYENSKVCIGETAAAFNVLELLRVTKIRGQIRAVVGSQIYPSLYHKVEECGHAVSIMPVSEVRDEVKEDQFGGGLSYEKLQSILGNRNMRIIITKRNENNDLIKEYLALKILQIINMNQLEKLVHKF